MADKVFILGVGPGSPEYLTFKASQLIHQSQLILGFRHTLNTVKELVKDKQVIELTLGNYELILAELSRETKQRNISILCTGDPNISDQEFVNKIFEYFPDAELIPGISSIQIAAARSKLALDQTPFLSFHLSGDLRDKKRCLLELVRAGCIVMVLPRPWDFMPDQIARFLMGQGVDPAKPVTVYQNLSLEDESSFHGSLKDLINRTFTDLCVMVIGK